MSAPVDTDAKIAEIARNIEDILIPYLQKQFPESDSFDVEDDLRYLIAALDEMTAQRDELLADVDLLDPTGYGPRAKALDK